MTGKKVYIGRIVSDKMDKTVVVAVERLIQHPTYKKIVKRITRFKAHDEKKECRVGDKVSIVEGRPISKEKRWRIMKIIERAE